jgi:hypothetical protein
MRAKIHFRASGFTLGKLSKTICLAFGENCVPSTFYLLELAQLTSVQA